MKHALLRFRALMVGLVMALCATTAQASEASFKPVDVILGHIGDSYEWHISGHTAIPLPVIVYHRSEGWNVFSSARLEHGDAYKGFYISPDGEYKGKVVYRNGLGEEVRPLDLSLTKNALALLLNSALVIFVILYVARWYKTPHGERYEAPKGFRGAMEMLIVSIHDDVIKPSVGKDYKKFAPYLLTAFFFIFFNNVMGLIPIFPGGANTTGNIAVTFILAFCTFLLVNIFGTKAYWKETVWPDVPWWLKVPIPIMPAVEIFGIFTKPFALMVRLFANILAGHSVILAFCCLIFFVFDPLKGLSPGISYGMTFLSVLFSIFMDFLEVLVAFIQAYVFVMLSAVFIGLARVEEHEHA